ncbi:hypothetical protein L2E82_16600 [Cichorium intybus]|uniref:Uncharacterized protein n=1 Tax=Cichorium intybus TaxID=13427 RepID=A0ACB9F6G5_CICIN|nr:hypothetical protein L2E82_16600 [Cichorium intybus]
MPSRSTSRTHCSRSSSSRLKYDARVVDFGVTGSSESMDLVERLDPVLTSASVSLQRRFPVGRRWCYGLVPVLDDGFNVRSKIT